jgi:protein-tyrosine phosphatase
MAVAERPYAAPMAVTDRWIPLTACFNFRDLGGLETVDGRRVRSGVLYRADALHRLTPDDLDVLRRLGLRTVIDLRTQGELDRHGRIALADLDEVVHHHLSMVDQIWSADDMPSDDDAPTPQAFGEGYLRMLDGGGAATATAIRLLADGETLPAVFHCTAGKDRTGVLAALVLGQLGVPDAAIAEDYALTERAVDGTRAWLEVNDPGVLGALPAWAWQAPAATMLAFLAQVRAEHGSISGLLTALGVSQATLDALDAVLLDP